MPNLLKGGFVGVDIFFVISGFLITLIIARETQVGTFSFRRFYARRIRRIFPALFVTLAVSLLFGMLFLYPSELSSLSAQALSAAAFVANIYFWMTTSYFSESSGQVALLHLWTLGLEEQYYLVWPLTLYLLIRIAQLNAKYLVLGLLLISFAINIKYYRWQPEAVFFLPPARFWEFFVGSALALFSISDSKIPPVNDFFREVISSVAFVVLVSTFFWIDDLKFPGW
jgi:peptidoglycan/LPS O-acetylase OafA/YrhL